jgi:two-component system, OmpR family, sensor histidine kinase SenX3
MGLLPKRAPGAFVVVVCLLAVLVTLAVLQYRWSGQISEAEQQRMRTSLRAAVAQFRDEFTRELHQQCRGLQIDPSTLRNRDWQQFARSCDDALNSTTPHIADKVYLWIRSEEGGQQLLLLDRTAKAFNAVPWPSSIESVRQRYAEAFSAEPPMRPEDRRFGWTMVSDLPLLLSPLDDFPAPQRLPGPAPEWSPLPRSSRGPAPRPDFRGYIVVELNRSSIAGTILPELARRFFSGPDGFVYQVAVTTGPGDILYKSDAVLAPELFKSPDARTGIFNVFRQPPPGEIGPGPEVASRGEPEGYFPLQGPAFSPAPGFPGENRARGVPVMLRAEEGSDWQLLVRHRHGSLEAVVAGARRRNLAIGFGVLVLLAASTVLIVASAHRAQRLAELQIDFVAGVSHELKTPLAVICSAGDNLAESAVANSVAQVREYGELIRDHGQRLNRIIDQILQFAAVRNGRTPYELKPACIGDIVEETLSRMLVTIKGAGFEIEKSLTPDLPIVRADAGALAQCIQNLIDNAIKYSGESRWLAVRTSVAPAKSGTEVLISVDDHGNGIDSADLPHLFDPFYRGQKVRSEQIHGTGLGLSVTQKAVAAMGGRITVQSAQGKGSSFTIHLPAMAPTTSELRYGIQNSADRR